MEDIDGGLHPAVDGQSLGEGEEGKRVTQNRSKPILCIGLRVGLSKLILLPPSTCAFMESRSFSSLQWLVCVLKFANNIQDQNAFASSAEISNEGDKCLLIESLVCWPVEKITWSWNLPTMFLEGYKKKDLFADEMRKLSLSIWLYCESGIAWHSCNKELKILSFCEHGNILHTDCEVRTFDCLFVLFCFLL